MVVWAALALAIIAPMTAAAFSPLLAWREPIYIIAGFAGILGMALLLIQPLLIGGYLPGFSGQGARRGHRWLGIGLLVAVMVHVIGLWITSPPDVIDALLFVSPTLFSIWGVTAMWAVFAAALLAGIRRKLRPRFWRLGHTFLAIVIAIGTVIHAILIEGTMETITKVALCVLVLLATVKVVSGVWHRTLRTRRRV